MMELGDLCVVTYQPMTVEWRILHFLHLPKNEVQSPRFIFDNAEWYFIFDPNGEQPWIALYLYMEDSLSPLQVTFTMGIKKGNGSYVNNDTYTFNFENGIGAGTDMFIRKSEFLNLTNEVCPGGIFTMYCSLSIDDGESALQASLLIDIDIYKREVKRLEEQLLITQAEKNAAVADARKDVNYELDGYRRRIEILERELSTDGFALKNLKRKVQDKEKELDGYRRRIKILEEELSNTKRMNGYVLENIKRKVLDTEKGVDIYMKVVKELEEQLLITQAEKKAAVADATKDVEQDPALSKNWEQLFQSGYEGDITMKVGKKEFLVHKVVLAARSSVFCAMLNADVVEKKDGVLNIEDCEPGPFEDFLRFLYSGQFDVVRSSNALKLCLIADKYNVMQLKGACFEVMKKEMSPESVCDAVMLASLYNEQELFDMAVDFFAENMYKVLCTPKWLSFVVEHKVIANELLVKSVEKTKK